MPGAIMRCPSCQATFELPSDEAIPIACPHCRRTFKRRSSRPVRDKVAPRPDPVPASGPGPTPGDTGLALGGYLLGRRLGGTSSGTVVSLARDPDLSRDVVIRLLRPAQAQSPRLRERLRVASKLRHPHLVPLLEASLQGERPFLVSGHVEGRSLAEMPAGERPDPRVAAQLVAELAEGLAHAHAAGLTHGAVGPENVLLDATGAAHLLNLGWAPAQDEPGVSSPERDLRDLGALLFWLLTGDQPRGAAASTQRLRRTVPPALATACVRALGGARRHATCGELAADLRRFLAGPPRRGRLLIAAVPGVLVVAGAVMLAIGFTSAGNEGERTPRSGEEVQGQHSRTEQALRDAEENLKRARLEVTQTEERATRAEADLQQALQKGETAADAALHLTVARHAQTLERALRACREGLPLQGEAILATVPPELAQLWETRFVRGLCRQGLRKLPGQASRVFHGCFSPDGRSVLSGGNDGALRLWNVASGNLERSFQAHQGGTRCVTFSPDGKTIASGGNDGKVRLWDFASGRQSHALDASVRDIRFSPDGQTLLTRPLSPQNSLTIWDVHAGRELFSLTDTALAVFNATFSPDGKRVFGWDPQGPTKFWDSRTGKEALPAFDANEPLRIAIYSPNGETMLRIPASGSPGLWDARSGKLLRKFEGSTRSASSVCFSPDGLTLAFGIQAVDGQPPEVKLIDVPTGEVKLSLPFQVVHFHGLCFSPDGKRLLTSGFQSVHLWDTRTGQLLGALGPAVAPPHQTPFSTDGQHILYYGRDFQLHLWDGQPRREARVVGTGGFRSDGFSSDGKVFFAGASLWDVKTGRAVGASTSDATCGALSPDGKRIASASGNRLSLIDAQSGQVLQDFSRSAGRISALHFSPSGEYLVSLANPMAGQSAEMKLWKVATAREVRTIDGVSGTITHACFTTDSKALFAGDFRKGKMWDVGTGQELLNLDVSVRSACFSPDGKGLFVSSGQEVFRLYDTKSGRELRSFSGHVGTVVAICCTPDGSSVASRGADGTVRLWDPRTGQERLALYGPVPNHFPGLCFSPDGNTLACGWGDQTIRVWEAAPRE